MFFWLEATFCAVANLSAAWCVMQCWRSLRRWEQLNRVMVAVVFGTWQLSRDGWPVRDIWRAQFEDHLAGRSCPSGE